MSEQGWVYTEARAAVLKKVNEARAWDDERVETLKALWASGKSCTEIGRFLGVSRNSVIGKVHRMGLDPRRGVQVQNGLAPKRFPAKAKPTPRVRVISDRQTFTQPEEPRPPRVIIGDAAWEPLAGSNPRPFTERPPLTCRWPVTDALMSCCLPAPEGPYCPAHERMAHPPKPVDRRNLKRVLKGIAT